MLDKPQILKQVCEALLQDRTVDARHIAQTQYPFESIAKERREYCELESTRVFIRDGFVDRYSGQRLIFPGTLRLLSTLLPESFPFHTNWMISKTHRMYWGQR